MTVSSHGKIHAIKTRGKLRALTSDRKLAVLIDRMIESLNRKARKEKR